MLSWMLISFGWVLYLFSLYSAQPWDDRLSGMALGLFTAALLSVPFQED